MHWRRLSSKSAGYRAGHPMHEALKAREAETWPRQPCRQAASRITAIVLKATNLDA